MFIKDYEIGRGKLQKLALSLGTYFSRSPLGESGDMPLPAKNLLKRCFEIYPEPFWKYFLPFSKYWNIMCMYFLWNFILVMKILAGGEGRNSPGGLSQALPPPLPLCVNPSHQINMMAKSFWHAVQYTCMTSLTSPSLPQYINFLVGSKHCRIYAMYYKWVFFVLNQVK